MGQIRRLSKNVSDKIAAGEVVERPLSVVKELVENAIDAGASAISVSLLGGGIRQISVTDNGAGIAADDASLVFEKHATSKIFTEQDLQYISTQGFRGEALSSISAVSMVEIRTKRREAEMGIILRASGGRMDESTPAGLPDGTSVTVSNLFFNVPARLKFLKSEANEAAYVSDLVSRYILAFPEISFHYSSQGKNIYHSPGNGSLRDAIYCVYGADLLESIVHVAHEVGDIRVDGFVSRPGLMMKNRQKGSVFVNRRFVRNSALHDMIKSAYGPMQVKGESPFFALNIFLSASAVDVNVHPNKLQVRFRDAAAVEYALKEAVSQAGHQIHGTVKLDVPAPPAMTVPKAVVEMQARPEVMQTSLFSGFTRTVMKETLRADRDDDENETVTPEKPPESDFIEEAKTAPFQTEQTEYQQEEPLIMSFGDKVIGSFADTYILVEQGDNLLIIDQHAAHERLLYDKFISGHFSASQPLLVPQVIKVSHAEKIMIDESIGVFQALGFDIEPFGALEYKIAAVPMLFYSASLYEMIAAALEEISQGTEDVVIKRERIIRAACRSAVKAGDKLSGEEIQSLVDSFLRTNVIPTCPHGRPVISVLTKKQIEKSFKRVL
jgi:DNA mismatch repair protein MutL